MTYAYVFLHKPSGDEAGYVERLRSFHEALAADPPVGFERSWTWRVGSGPLGEAFEDWYAVESWAALEALNEAAVSGSRRLPHDAVAPLSAAGAGAIYRLVRGSSAPGAAHRARLSKPVGTSYADVVDRLAALPVAAVWMRQMVLGPDAEFLVDAAGDVPGLELTPLEAVWP